MESMGVLREEIHKFSEPGYWLQYWPPIAKSDLQGLGCKIDWRRSFLTTDVNPYYDSFVRWQFNKLYALKKIKFGERHTIWSPNDNQPCMDHDRQSGEGVGPQEYTGIKLRILKDRSRNSNLLSILGLDSIKNKSVYLVAATLRPETMYGQTNCFVGRDLEYGFWEINDSEVFVSTERAAKNMSYQGFSKSKGKCVKLASILGKDLIGCAVNAPLSSFEFVYVLPLDHVVANKGTGIVTSVPSDSPDDYAMTRDLKKKPEFYGIEPEWIVPFEPMCIISTPTYGDMSAQRACELLKISSPKDRMALDKAKELVYKEGFYSGKMIVGPHKGKSVTEARLAIRSLMVANGEALVYSEPEKDIISRSGDECVVNLCDQWYLDYGEESWKVQAEKALSQLNTYHPETRNAFKQTLDWLNKWACARSFGLGTKLPWDQQFLIESLSDSTVYMAYYTVAHFLHSDLEGKQPGLFQISASNMTDEVWEYIFNESAKYSTACNVPQAQLDQMRAEFTYFYPLDLRVSGKDLVPNHLTFFLYNHVCLFEEKHWPKGIRANGHLLFNSEKMSKSTGTFVTARQALERFGADCTRFALADAGDAVEDANFVEGTANAAILRLFTQKEWFIETYAQLSSMRAGEHTFSDKVFLARMAQLLKGADEMYEQMMFREALKLSFFEFQDARDQYREQTQLNGEGMHRELLHQFMRLQAVILSPITPHWSEYIWRTVLQNDSTVLNESWPEFRSSDIPNSSILEAADYLKGVIHTIRTCEAALLKKKKVVVSRGHRKCTIFVAETYPKWQEEVISVLKVVFEDCQGNWQGKDIAAMKQADLLKNKKVMPFVNEMKKNITQNGKVAFERGLSFNERKVIEENLLYIQKSVQMDEMIIKPADHENLDAEELKKAELAVPGNPGLKLDLD
jgi:leucyl-tRNA synthetase